MKCTNFREELKLIHQKELDELIAALEAHGGEYEFADGEERDKDDLGNYPQVSLYKNYEWKMFRVEKAFLNEEGKPCLLGSVTEMYGGCSCDDYVGKVNASDVMTGDMLYIISMMDEPKQ